MPFVPSVNCMSRATTVAEQRLTMDEIAGEFEALHQKRLDLERSGSTDVKGELQRFAQSRAERAKIMAAMQRRHAALNVIIRSKIDDQVSQLIADGLSPRKALMAILEGSQRNVQNARKSVAATRTAKARKYTGRLLAEIYRDKPHLIALLGDKKLDIDVVTEMMELRDGGTPGKTGNSDAQYLAKTFSKHAELVRTELNRLGASIGKLAGWAGPQVHDEIKLIRAGKIAWVDQIFGHLDVARTFPDLSVTEAKAALSDIYDTIITGVPRQPTGGEMGQRVSPANMAKALGKHRALHFKDAAHTIAYREKFGHGNAITGMINHMQNSARVAANMEVLGPNPEVMFNAVAESLKRAIKENPNLPEAMKAKQVAEISVQTGAMRTALDISTGAFSRPDNVTWAKIGADVRAWQSMSKLGGALFSSLGEPLTVAIAASFRTGHSNLIPSFIRQIGGVLQGRPKGEQAEIGFLLGEGFEGLIGHIVNPHAAVDGVVGQAGKLQELFFKLNGLTWWTDVGRSVAGRMISAEMGMRAEIGYDALPTRYRYVLEMHGIDQVRWDIIRSARMRNVNGSVYVTPDRVADLPDDAFMPLVADRLATAKTDEARAGIINDARRDVEESLLRFVTDETSYGVVTTDAKSQRWAALSQPGARPGTAGGELLKMVMQFKGFPLAFTDRVMGRAALGFRGDQRGQQFAHIATLILGLGMAGYMQMSMKDLAKGYWPPRDPGDWKTWMSAFQQGGAWGIYGDFLFSSTNRFGGGLAETAAGPTVGSILDLAQIAMEGRDFAFNTVAGNDDARFSAGKMVSWLSGNLPGYSLFYTKPAIDYLVMNAAREMASPGYLRRVAKKRKAEYGQQKLDPLGLGENAWQ